MLNTAPIASLGEGFAEAGGGGVAALTGGGGGGGGGGGSGGALAGDSVRSGGGQVGDEEIARDRLILRYALFGEEETAREPPSHVPRPLR